MNIRKIEGKDFEIINKLYKKLYKPDEPDVDLVGKKINAEMISLLIEEDRKIIGFISGTVVNYSTKIEGQIWDLMVDENYRRKGYGRKLVQEFEEIAVKLGATYMMVWTDPSPDEEDPTLFYEKSGYHKLKHSILTKKLE